MSDLEFQPFPKIARLNREIVVTEKIDGSNAAVIVKPIEYDGSASSLPSAGSVRGPAVVVYANNVPYLIAAQSRKRIISPGKQTDNFGFAGWVRERAQELAEGLGEGVHFGEWYGQGIQRGYGLDHKRFALFNTHRWEEERPACCDVVPVLYQGLFSTVYVKYCLGLLSSDGSVAAPGFMDPEGIVIYHTAAQTLFKVTIKGDESPKGARP